MEKPQRDKPQHRILMVSYNTPPWHFAGAGNQAVMLSRKLLALGCRVTLTSASGDEGLWQADNIEELPVIRLRGHDNKYLRLLLFIIASFYWWLVNFGRFNIVHIHGCTHLTTLVWVLLAKMTGRKVLMKTTCQGVDDATGIAGYPVLGTMAMEVFSRVDGYIALSPAIAEDYVRHGLGDRTFLIPNGVDRDRFHPAPDEAARQKLRKDLGWPEDVPVLLYVGGINPRKNPVFLIHALKHLRKKLPKARLCLLGPVKGKFAAYAEELDGTVAAEMLADAVERPGEVTSQETVKYMQAADVFVFASTREGMPSAPLEAMACGLPAVMVRDEAGTLEWMTDMPADSVRPARLTDNDPEAFARALLQVLSDESLRQRMEEASQKLIERYELGSVAERYRNEIYPAL